MGRESSLGPEATPAPVLVQRGSGSAWAMARGTQSEAAMWTLSEYTWDSVNLTAKLEHLPSSVAHGLGRASAGQIGAESFVPSAHSYRRQSPTVVAGTSSALSSVSDKASPTGGLGWTSRASPAPSPVESDGPMPPSCQPATAPARPLPLPPGTGCRADGCSASLVRLSYYHRRNRICSLHIKADSFCVAGRLQRFCQRCGHTHDLGEFDRGKHSCRVQLAKHNARRRKAQQGAQDEEERAADMRQAAARRSRRADRPSEQPAPRRLKRGARRVVEGAQDAEEAAFPREAGTEEVPVLVPPVPISTKREKRGEPAPQASVWAPVHPPAEDLAQWLTQQLSQAEMESLPLPAASVPEESAAMVLAEDPLWDVDLWQLPGGSDLGADAFSLGDALVRASAPGLALQEMEGAAFESSKPASASSSNLFSPPPASALEPSTPPGSAEPLLVSVSVKLFGATPADLPPDLRSQLCAWFSPHLLCAMEGYLRPGCIHLVVQAIVRVAEEAEGVEREEAKMEKKQGRSCCSNRPPSLLDTAQLQNGTAVVESASRAMLARWPSWSAQSALVQSGEALAMLHAGRLVRSWSLAGEAPNRVLPRVQSVEPRVLAVGGADRLRLRVSGINILQDDTQVLCRLHGAFLEPRSVGCADCECNPTQLSGSDSEEAAASLALGLDSPGLLAQGGLGGEEGKLSFLSSSKEGEKLPTPPASWSPRCCGCCIRRLSINPSPLPAARPLQHAAWEGLAAPRAPGLLYVDVQSGHLLCPHGAQVLLVDSSAVAAELARLPAPALQARLPALGLVFEWAGQPAKVSEASAEPAAASLLRWAVRWGLPATAERLLDALRALAGARASRVHLAGSPSSPWSALDLLEAAASSVQAAALRRAASRSRNADSASSFDLLHLGALSGSPPMVRAVLGWGEAARQRCDPLRPGPCGLTALHLSALMGGSGVAEVLLASLPRSEALQAWTTAQAGGGATPEALARRAGYALDRQTLVLVRRSDASRLAPLPSSQARGGGPAAQAASAAQPRDASPRRASLVPPLQPRGKACCGGRQPATPAPASPVGPGSLPLGLGFRYSPAASRDLAPGTPVGCHCRGACPCSGSLPGTSESFRAGCCCGSADVGACCGLSGSCPCCQDAVDSGLRA